MRITAAQLVADAERQNKKAFDEAMTHLTFITQSFKTGIATSTDPNLQQAFKGTLDNATRFMDNRPFWQRAEIEIPSQT